MPASERGSRRVCAGRWAGMQEPHGVGNGLLGVSAACFSSQVMALLGAQHGASHRRCFHWLEVGALVWLCGTDPGWGRHLSRADSSETTMAAHRESSPLPQGSVPNQRAWGWGGKLARERRLWEGMVSCGSTLGGGAPGPKDCGPTHSPQPLKGSPVGPASQLSPHPQPRASRLLCKTEVPH